MTPEEELGRAQEAQLILEHPLFKDAVREIESALLLGIRKSAFKDAELREKLCHQYTLLHGLVDQFRTHMETGKLAEATLRERAVQAAKRVVNW